MLTTPYLKALEQSLPSNIFLYYVGILKNEKLVGIILIEHVKVYVRDMFQKRSSSIFKTFLRNSISMMLRGNILVVGNLTHTGQHGMSFLANEISLEIYFNTLIKATKDVENIVKNNFGKKINLLLFKDFFLDDKFNELTLIFQSERFSKVRVQPNMIMLLEPQWKKMEDYVNSLNKKYKTRYKRAQKKFGNFEKIELDEKAIEDYSNILHELYGNVSNNAKFNTFFLPENHFLSLKKELRENYKIFGYFSKTTLVGFYSLILNDKVLETYFLGYDSEHQQPNQLYLNMLYDMLDFAISNRFETVVYARTAMEIKSSVGAEPKEMLMYIKHTNRYANAVLKFIFNFIKPNQKWEQRHPFQ